MKKTIFTLLCVMCVCNSVFSQVSTNYRVNGVYLNKKNGEVRLEYYKDTVLVTLKAPLMNGKFSLEGYVTEPTRAYIDEKVFWLEPNNIELTLDANKQNIISVKGSKNQKIQDLEDEMMSKAETKEQRVKIWKQTIAQYPDSYVAGEALFMLVGNRSCSVEESDSLLKTLSPDIQKSFSGRLVEDFIVRQKNMIPGRKAPYWKAKEESPYWLGQNMTTTSLSDFKGKVLLMDAWASSCTYCREAFKRMKPFYEQYHNQGFEIVGVNVDLRRTAEWKKAIKEDSIESWHHVQIATDLRSTAPFSYKPNDINGNYYIQAVPVRILIDKKGIIRGHWVGFNEDKEDAIYKLILELLAEKD